MQGDVSNRCPSKSKFNYLFHHLSNFINCFSSAISGVRHLLHGLPLFTDNLSDTQDRGGEVTCYYDYCGHTLWRYNRYGSPPGLGSNQVNKAINIEQRIEAYHDYEK